MNKGKVYLIGAGPGDPELLTLKGKRILGLADVVVYDRLVNNKMLQWINPKAELIYVGKEKGFHLISQEKISKILIKKAKENKIVARLKGGDPFVLARGAEEAEALACAKINFEIIPGVTSATAVPAYAGIPVTHRDYCSSLTIATGHKDVIKSTSKINWKSLALQKGTLVFLMGVSNLKNITTALISAGKSPKTPSAVISWGTYPEQKTITGNLKNIAALADKNKIASPGILVIGKVVNLQKKLSWFEKKPLFGKRILVTRAGGEDSKKLTSLLEDQGAKAYSWPVIKRVAIKSLELKKTLLEAKKYDYLIFTSPATIDFIIDYLKRLKGDIRYLKRPKIVAIGPVTKESLEKYKLNVNLIPEKFSTSGLIEKFKKINPVRCLSRKRLKVLRNLLSNGVNLKNKKILILTSVQAPKTLSQNLAKLGASVKTISIYQTLPEKYSVLEVKSKLKQKIDIITFASSSAVEYFYQLTKKYVSPKKLKPKIACLGPATAKTAKKLGYKVWVVAKIYTLEGLVNQVITKITYKHK